MIVSDFIQRALLLATGKTTTLATTDTKYNKLLAIANVMQRLWMTEPDTSWNSLYQLLSLGTINGNSVPMDDSILEVSKREDDSVVIAHVDGVTKSYYDIVTPDQLGNSDFRYGQNCAVVNGNLVFAHTFVTSDPQYNGEVFIPAYIELDDLADPSDDILVDDPNWLIYMTAAEYVRNDVTKVQQYPNLVALGKVSMDKMHQNNEGQLQSIPVYRSSYGETWDAGTFADNGTFEGY